MIYQVCGSKRYHGSYYSTFFQIPHSLVDLFQVVCPGQQFFQRKLPHQEQFNETRDIKLTCPRLLYHFKS